MSMALKTGDSRRSLLLATKSNGGGGGGDGGGGNDGNDGGGGVIARCDLVGEAGFSRAKSSAGQSGCLSCAMSNAVSPVLVLCTMLAPASSKALTTAGGVSRQKQAYCNTDRLAPCAAGRYCHGRQVREHSRTATTPCVRAC